LLLGQTGILYELKYHSGASATRQSEQDAKQFWRRITDNQPREASGRLLSSESYTRDQKTGFENWSSTFIFLLACLPSFLFRMQCFSELIRIFGFVLVFSSRHSVLH